MSYELYQFCVPFLFQVHKMESRLIKIKWSELTFHFSLHLWSICFQIYSGCSNFSGLTLVQFTLLHYQTHRSKHVSKDGYLFGRRGLTSPQLSISERISVLHLFSLSVVKHIYESTSSFMYASYVFLKITDVKFANYNFVSQVGWRLILALSTDVTSFSSCLSSLFKQRPCLIASSLKHAPLSSFISVSPAMSNSLP